MQFDKKGNKMVQNTFSQIERLSLNASKPLLVVDADEVLVLFASHLKTFLQNFGWDLNLKGYRLDNAITNLKDGHIADTATYKKLISDFIRDETIRQPEAAGASKVLKMFKHRANIVILTNVPHSAYEKRVRNLSKLNMEYPIVSNTGSKGPALAKLGKLTSGKCIFIDDNPFQINSSAEYTPNWYRFHFTACSIVKKTMPIATAATHRPKTWNEIANLLDKILP